MIDINIYRLRIGYYNQTFKLPRKCRKRHFDKRGSRHRHYNACFILKLLIIILILQICLKPMGCIFFLRHSESICHGGNYETSLRVPGSCKLFFGSAGVYYSKTKVIPGKMVRSIILVKMNVIQRKP